MTLEASRSGQSLDVFPMYEYYHEELTLSRYKLEGKYDNDDLHVVLKAIVYYYDNLSHWYCFDFTSLYESRIS